MQRTPKYLIASFALFALLGAQVFGLQRGYECLCTGEVVESVAPSCEEDSNCCDHEHDGAPHGHKPVTVKHEAQGKNATTPQVQAPVLLAILDLKDIIAFSIVPPAAEAVMSRPPPGLGSNPPAALLVAQCTVLLI